MESKRRRIRHMNPRKVTLLILVTTSASLTLAEDFKTVTGKEYKNATVSHIEADGIVLKTKSGISKVYFVELTKEVQQRFGYDVTKLAEQASEVQKQQEAAERERQKKEENAEADLKQVVDRLLATEQRAAQSYRSATKGTLSGQVFVSSKGGENFKLGAVQVALFSRDAVDILVAGLKTYADIKIQELTRAANAPPDTTREQEEILAKRDSYYSGLFYFSYLQSPIQSVETDADGKFTIEVLKQGAFVIAARAERYVGKEFIGEVGIDRTEHYYWLQPVSLNGQQQLTQNLSNNNLTSTTGISLLHTQD